MNIIELESKVNNRLKEISLPTVSLTKVENDFINYELREELNQNDKLRFMKVLNELIMEFAS